MDGRRKTVCLSPAHSVLTNRLRDDFGWRNGETTNSTGDNLKRL